MIRIKKYRQNYKEIKICSDLHFGHNRDFLYSKRGFENSGEHDSWIQSQISSLHYSDLLICLGDVGLTIGATKIIEFINTIPCETIMVWGNHNSGVRQMYNQALENVGQPTNVELYPLKLNDKITMFGDSLMLSINHNLFYCTHMAPLIFPEMSRDSMCLCGHSHSSLDGINPNSSTFGKILDCGVENSLKYNGTAFFSYEEALDILNAKTKSTFDHH